MEGEEQAGAGAFIGFHREHGVAVEQDVASGDGVVRMSRDGFGEGGLAGPVGAHDRMDFALVNGECDAFDNRFVADGNVEVLDEELAHWISR